MRRVYQGSYITDDGRVFTENGVELTAFMVQDQEELLTLDGFVVYRNSLNEDDDPRVLVFKFKDGTYRSYKNFGLSVERK